MTTALEDRLYNALREITILVEYRTSGEPDCKSDPLTAEKATALRKSISSIARDAAAEYEKTRKEET